MKISRELSNWYTLSGDQNQLWAP